MKLLLTIAETARVLDMPPGLVYWRGILRGDLPVARRNPIRFRWADVERYRSEMKPVRPYTKRATSADHLAQSLSSKLDKITTGV